MWLFAAIAVGVLVGILSSGKDKPKDKDDKKKDVYLPPAQSPPYQAPVVNKKDDKGDPQWLRKMLASMKTIASSPPSPAPRVDKVAPLSDLLGTKPAQPTKNDGGWFSNVLKSKPDPITNPGGYMFNQAYGQPKPNEKMSDWLGTKQPAQPTVKMSDWLSSNEAPPQQSVVNDFFKGVAQSVAEPRGPVATKVVTYMPVSVDAPPPEENKANIPLGDVSGFDMTNESEYIRREQEQLDGSGNGDDDDEDEEEDVANGDSD